MLSSAGQITVVCANWVFSQSENQPRPILAGAFCHAGTQNSNRIKRAARQKESGFAGMPRVISPRRPHRIVRRRPLSIIPPQPSRSFQPSPVEGVPPRSPNLDCGRCVKSAGVSRTPRTKVEHYQPNNKLSCRHTSKHSSRSLSQSSTGTRTRHPSFAGFRKRCLRATETESPQARRGQRLSVRDKAAGAVLAKNRRPISPRLHYQQTSTP